MVIKFPIQASKKHCWYCHFLDSREGCLHPDPNKERYWCNAFAQQVHADKQDRPERVEACKEAEVVE